MRYGFAKAAAHKPAAPADIPPLLLYSFAAACTPFVLPVEKGNWSLDLLIMLKPSTRQRHKLVLHANRHS